MDLDPYSKAVAAGEKKSKKLAKTPGLYFLSALQAGAYLSIVVFVFWTIRQLLGGDASAKLLSSMFFGVGLSVIIFTETDLFTSNNMYMTISTLAGKTTIGDTLKLWVTCWLGNFTGAFIVAAVLFAGSFFQTFPDSLLMDGAHHKIELSASDIFFKGIIANWIVCLAVWVNLHLKEEIARMVAVILVVFIFLLLGGEHSIANMGTFADALFIDPTLPVSGIAHNLLWSTLGNIVGGGVGLGLVAWTMNKGH